MTHQFDVHLAEKYGIEEAIIIEHIYWWLHKNECEEEMIKEGRVWCYFTADGMSKYIPYMNSQKVRRTLVSLEKKGLVLVGCFNKVPTNHTLWYSFTDDFFKEMENRNYDVSDFSKMKNRNFKNEKSNNIIINNNLKEDNILENRKRLSKDNPKMPDDLFVEFWEKYGYKKGKQPCLKAWNRLTKEQKKAAIAGIELYKEDCRDNRRHMKHPATYLNQLTWEDDFTNNGMVAREDDEPQEEDNGWKQQLVWLNNEVPNIAPLITRDMITTFKTICLGDSYRMARVLRELNNLDFDGDIVTEFKKVKKEFDNE